MAQLRSRFVGACGEAGGADGRCGGTGGDAEQDGRGLATVGRFSATLKLSTFSVTLNIRFFQ